jgi:drug/metabolite transporter (DMT)-like permease
MTRSIADSPSSLAKGVIYGGLTVLIWSAYNVGSKIGAADGFRSIDLMFLRFLAGSTVMLPLLLMSRPRVGATAGWQTLVVLGLAGPVFAVLVATGFQYGPLSHGVIIGPSVSITVANLLVWSCDGQRPSRQRLGGIGILICGLALIAVDAGWNTGRSPVSRAVIFGDAAFAAAGALWGAYIYLLGRWQLPPLRTAGQITVLSAIIVTPLYLVLTAPPAISPDKWAEQAVYQGIMGGALAFLSFACTVTHLGAAQASLFLALVPPTALLMAIPMLGDIPTTFQGIAIGLGAAGIVMSMEPRWRRR